MPLFKYKAITSNGKIVQNKNIEAINRKALIRKLKTNDLTPIEIIQLKRISKRDRQKKKKNISNVNDILGEVNINNYINSTSDNKKTNIFQSLGISINSKIKTRDIVIFTQNLYLLKKANFNNIHALSTIVETTENPQLKEIVRDILAGVEAGEYMYTTMEYYSDIFPYLYINMIRVGEQSGELAKALKDAIDYLEDNEKFNKKIRGILVPNLLMFIGIFAILIVGVVVIIPILQDLFASMGSTKQLPAITLWFSNAVNVITKVWYIPLITIAAIIALIYYYITTPKGRYNFDYFKYKMPLFGKLIFSLDFLRFAKAMLLNLNNGIRIQDSLETSKNVVKNLVLRSIIESSINDLILGQSWVDAFERSNLPSPMITEMLNIGMSTDLREMMSKLLEYLQIDINNTMEKIVKVLPEIVYVFVGIALIFLVLVVLVPCIEAYMGGWLFEAAGL